MPDIALLFALTGLNHAPTAESCLVTMVTDVPCHSYMWYSSKIPLKSIRKIYERGVFVRCIVHSALRDVNFKEQLEPGDTILHSFYFEDWPICTTKWYRFTAFIGGVKSPSATAIYKYHNPYPLPPYFSPSNDEYLTGNAPMGFCQEWNATGQLFTPDHDYYCRQYSVDLCQYQTDRWGPFFFELRRWISEYSGGILLHTTYCHSLLLPPPVFHHWRTSTPCYVKLTAGTKYFLVVHTVPGWFLWNEAQKRWLPSETSAALFWLCNTNPPIYTRGYHIYGWNYGNNTGYWYKSEGHDQNFRIWE